MFWLDPEVTSGMNEVVRSIGPLNTAVLFVVFNRPDTTARVFEAIRQAKPPKLYVAADGPREGHVGENERVAKVREIATSVDWPCEVRTLFRRENVGCKYAPSEAIDWFFSKEKEGIILEDDCLPHASFFDYCEWALERFRKDKRIWHINGNNFAAEKRIYRQEVDFVSLPQVWGWATWRDRWQYFDVNPFYVERRAASKWKSWRLSNIGRLCKLGHLKGLTTGLDAWDYQWQVSVLNGGGLVISARSNLISNLGDGADATHTQVDSRSRLPTESFVQPSRELKVAPNKELNTWFEEKMGLRSIRRAVRILVRRGITRGKATGGRLLRLMMFRETCPIVIASTGRSGSTMLFGAITESFSASRFIRQRNPLKNLLRRISSGYLDRISDIRPGLPPILKTHDVYHDRFEGSGRFIFIYGDPLESAMSVEETGRTRGAEWIEEHIYHLGGHGSPREIYQKDVLNFRNQILSWGSAKSALCIHYDDLWSFSQEISEFLGFPVELPKRRERTAKQRPTSYNKTLFDELQALANDLRRRSPVSRP